MLKNIGLFCKRALQKRPVFCKETCIFKHPTNRSHPIPLVLILELIFVFVNHDIYILLHACSTTLRFLHSWADGVLHEHMAISCVTLACCNMVCYISVCIMLCVALYYIRMSQHAVCFSALWCGVPCCSVLHCICSVLQRVAACCSVLQRVTAYFSTLEVSCHQSLVQHSSIKQSRCVAV